VVVVVVVKQNERERRCGLVERRSQATKASCVPTSLPSTLSSLFLEHRQSYEAGRKSHLSYS
jgi:hypothetical protein